MNFCNMTTKMIQKTAVCLWAVFVCVGLGVAHSSAQAHIPDGHAKFFKSKVLPLLESKCFKCHGEKKQRGKLRLDSLANIKNGGDSGVRLIVPHKPEKSLLYISVTYKDLDLQMPEKGKLPDEEIAIIKKWIELGAPWPGAKQDKPSDVVTKKGITEADRAWWSYQPVKDPDVPDVDTDGWAINAVDKFIYRKLKDMKLSPAKRADKYALVRRVYQDLTGLPPTPEQVKLFVEDESEDAYEKLIDRLLASPRYGERWGRHWLDLVRYAESDGYRGDFYRPNAWRYRDYVIKSFNEDKPYAQFIKEQLAGDELDPTQPENLVATGYLRHGIYEWNQRDAITQWENVLGEMVDVTGETILGMSVGCARCHDHKFDAILHEDYYAMRAFFASVIWRDDIPIATPEAVKAYQAKEEKWLAENGELLQAIRDMEKKYKERGERTLLNRFVEEMRNMYETPVEKRTTYEMQIADFIRRQVVREQLNLKPKSGDEKKKYDALIKQKKEAEKSRPKPLPQGQVATDVLGKAPPPTVIPGDRKKQEIKPGFPQVIDTSSPEISTPEHAPDSTGRRLALAKWVVSEDNPLTYRVITNRIWQYHFGRGIVGTPSEFGHLGEKPTHPELLDWLTSRFIEHGGRFKPMHKLILMSATYQQSAIRTTPEQAMLKDPSNRYYWKMNTHRLHAEQIRDAMLQTTGELDTTMYGAASSPASTRRTVYTRVVRNKRDALLDLYDWPDAITPAAVRPTTTTPNQALLMINNSYTLKRAEKFAKSLLHDHRYDPDHYHAIVKSAYLRSFSRPAKDDEVKTGVRFIQQQMLALSQEADEKTVKLPVEKQHEIYREKALTDFAHILLNANEFLYID